MSDWISIFVPDEGYPSIDPCNYTEEEYMEIMSYWKNLKQCVYCGRFITKTWSHCFDAVSYDVICSKCGTKTAFWVCI
jgi:hypothetical protein